MELTEYATSIKRTLTNYANRRKTDVTEGRETPRFAALLVQKFGYNMGRWLMRPTRANCLMSYYALPIPWSLKSIATGRRMRRCGGLWSVSIFAKFIGHVEIGEKKAMISESFALKVADIGYNKGSPIALMNELDEEKCSIRSFMRKFSNEPKNDGGGAGSERYRKLRRLKDRIAFLIEEREYVRQKLVKIEGDQKALNKASNRKKEFCHAFLAAAE